LWGQNIKTQNDIYYPPTVDAGSLSLAWQATRCWTMREQPRSSCGRCRTSPCAGCCLPVAASPEVGEWAQGSEMGTERAEWLGRDSGWEREEGEGTMRRFPKTTHRMCRSRGPHCSLATHSLHGDSSLQEMTPILSLGSRGYVPTAVATCTKIRAKRRVRGRPDIMKY